jgi:hypothetical protein
MSNIDNDLAKLDAELNTINAERDALAVKAKDIAAKRAKLFDAKKLADQTNDPAMRAHILAAVGISSAESVGGQ